VSPPPNSDVLGSHTHDCWRHGQLLTICSSASGVTLVKFASSALNSASMNWGGGIGALENCPLVRGIVHHLQTFYTIISITKPNFVTQVKWYGRAGVKPLSARGSWSITKNPRPLPYMCYLDNLVALTLYHMITCKGSPKIWRQWGSPSFMAWLIPTN